MKLLKPAWVNHNGCAIYSIDIHPDMTRFATGGLGNDCGKIVIWSLGPVIYEDQEKDESIQKELCHMDNHLSCVNCVRWSNSGKFLASGSDDKLIIIWKMAENTNIEAKHEMWKLQNMLRGHVGDVLDLAWSPHDIYLASGSVDNTIIIWNAINFPEILHVLKTHTGLVKGVTWDPTGKYMASQSDDKSIKIWQTKNWTLEASITKPFKECGGTTHILRLGWSPDGHYIVSAHAMNNAGPTAQIIERSGWKTNMDFVGHRKAINCVRFNPCILVKKINKNSSKPQQYSVCALGSKDKSLSIWMTALKRPLVVVHSLFNQAVMDLSWGCDGRRLMVCSLDGTVAYLEFDLDEIGKPLSKQDQLNMQKKIYGKEYDLLNPYNLLSNTQNGSSQNSLTTPQSVKSVTKLNEIKIKEIVTRSDKQIEYRLPNGQRRITPIYLYQSDDVYCETFSGSSTNKKSQIIIEKRAQLHSTLFSQSPTTAGQGTEQHQTYNLQTPNQKTTPYGQDSNNLSFTTPTQTPREIYVTPVGNILCSSKSLTAILDRDAAVAAPISQTFAFTGTPFQESANFPNRFQYSVPPYHKKIYYQIKRTGCLDLNLKIKNHQLKTAHNLQSPIDNSSTHLNMHLVVVKAYQNHPSNSPADSSLKHQSQTLYWHNSFTYAPVNLVSHNQQVIALSMSTFPGLLFLSINTGRLLSGPLALSSNVIYLLGRSSFTLAITANANLYLWKSNLDYLNSLECVLSDIPITPLTNSSSSLKFENIEIDEKNGNPILTCSNDQKYLYDLNMKSWILIESGNDILSSFYARIYATCEPESQNNDKQLFDDLKKLKFLKTSSETTTTTSLNQHLTDLLSTNNSLKGLLAEESILHLVRFLQSKCTSALSTRNDGDLEYWFSTMLRHLCQADLQNELIDIIQSLSFLTPGSSPEVLSILFTFYRNYFFTQLFLLKISFGNEYLKT